MRKLLLLVQNYQTQISTALLFLGSLVLVVYLSPREAKFKYEFQKAKPWQHADLLAPFDFAIQKSSEDLQEERAAINAQKTIFLRYVEGAEKEALAKYQSEFEPAWQKALKQGRFNFILEEGDTSFWHDNLYEAGKSTLSGIFKEGILQPADEDPLLSQYGEVQLRRGSLVENVEWDQFYTISQADQAIRERLKDRYPSAVSSFLAARVASGLRYNIVLDPATTEKVLADQLQNILPTRGMVEEGELIIAKGNLVDQERFAKLRSLQEVYEGSLSGDHSYFGLLFGQILLAGILFFALFAYLRQFEPLVLEDIARLTFILLNILIMVLAAFFIGRFPEAYIFLVPFAILPMVMRSFFDIRLALFVHTVTILLIGFQVPNSFQFTFLQFIAGVFSVLLVNNLYKRRDLFITAGKITLVYAISYFSLAILQEGSLSEINYLVFTFFIINGLLTLVSFPLIYFQERLFGLVSEISLLELSDTNNPLLRELAETAPGTFQHVMQVANLTENAAIAIGGNALLARTGALYHDIGKMQSPMYFIENQSTGINPHDELSFEESAEIIIGHVTTGITMAKKHKLPDILIDFIRTHHGTSTVMYFYRQYIKDFPEDERAMEKFTYPGPKPFSKETALLMMADTVEAASRSIDSPDHDKIDSLVENLIDGQIKSGQFENAPITLREIRTVKKIFKKMLMNIYHVRIKYPD
jgi:putative nucleotidyltransferase with HDIG domain